MRQVTLGRTKVPVSAISLGTWAFGGTNMVGKIPLGWGGQKKEASKKTKVEKKEDKKPASGKTSEKKVEKEKK